MHFYRHNIGDYRRDTSHLTLLEHGVYRQLLDTYYLHEAPIPLDLDQVCRRLIARTDEERRAIETVLKEFFERTDAGWIHSRCEDELAEYRAKAEIARTNGRLGGRRRQDGTRSVSAVNPDGTQSVSAGNPEETQRKANHKPRTKNQEPQPKPAQPVDLGLFDQFWAAYPRKVAKPEAMKAWLKLRPEADLLAAILAGLARAKQSRDWLKDDGQYIPHPSTWLNQRRWEDEVEAVAEGGDAFEGLI